jgi:putative oxidoreductase
VAARAFFIPGQAKIEGPSVSLFGRSELTITLPAQIKDTTFTLFQTQYSGLPLPPNVAAYLFTYAEFVLPICLVIGFATRLSALALLVMTVLIQIYVAPDLLWTLHAYLIAILAVLISLGPGAISADGLLRYLSSK